MFKPVDLCINRLFFFAPLFLTARITVYSFNAGIRSVLGIRGYLKPEVSVLDGNRKSTSLDQYVSNCKSLKWITEIQSSSHTARNEKNSSFYWSHQKFELADKTEHC